MTSSGEQSTPTRSVTKPDAARGTAAPLKRFLTLLRNLTPNFATGFQLRHRPATSRQRAPAFQAISSISSGARHLHVAAGYPWPVWRSGPPPARPAAGTQRQKLMTPSHSAVRAVLVSERRTGSRELERGACGAVMNKVEALRLLQGQL